MEERRRGLRRTSDRQLWEAYNRLKHEAEENGGVSGARKLLRRAIRHHCKVTIALEGGIQSGRSDTWRPMDFSVKGRVLDLSSEGCSLFTRDAIPIGTNMMLRIELEDYGTIESRATVRWSKAIPAKGGVASGTQFAGLSAPHQRRVEEFLKHLDHTAGL